jgi:two-component system response regulator RegA
MDQRNAHKPMASAAAQSAGRVAEVPARPSILVVDDEENFLTLLQWFLTQRGYQVTTASSTEQALSLLDGRVFEVALLDIRLGAGDGMALLEELTQRLPGLKVFMMTAYPTVSSIKQAFDKGALRYLTKPVDLQELAEALRSLF